MPKSLPSAAYWRERAERRMEFYHRSSDQTLRTISTAHQRALDNIQADLDRIFGNYARRNNLTLDEARAYLANPAGYAEYERLLKLAGTVTDPETKRDLLARINAPAARYRMSRLEALQQSMYAEAMKLAEVELHEATKAFWRTVEVAYGHSMYDIQRGTGIGFAFDAMSSGAVKEILHNPWSGLAYSDRIWGHGQALNDWMQEHLTAGLMNGRPVRQLSRELADHVQVKYHAAERLVRTEMTHMANAAEMESYKAAGITHYRFLATLDNRTSQACQDLDNQLFEVAKAAPGENMPPMHPYCRSTTTCAIDQQTLETMKRRARNPVTGELVELPAWMTYKDWRQLMIDTYGEEQVVAAYKMAANEAVDKEQFARYQSVLGKKNVPGTFAEFQVIKYNGHEEYGVLEAQMRGMGYYNRAIEQEKAVTDFVTHQAMESGFLQEGLEQRVKSRDSYLRKIRQNYSPDGNTYEIHDLLRYTYIALPDELTEKTLSCIDSMDSMGYNTLGIKNYWLDLHNPYNGINTKVRAPSGQPFEIQYHTPESFALKNGKLHELYEQARELDPRDPRFIELEERMFELSDGLQEPADIERVVNRP